MRFGKRTMFLALNGLILLGLLLHFSFWLLSPRVTGLVQRPLHATRMLVSYTVDGTSYEAVLLRSDVGLAQTEVPLLVLFYDHSEARVFSLMGLAAEPLGWWLVFLLGSAALLLTHNTVFTRGTVFEFRRRFPWISMEEYLPFEADHPGTRGEGRSRTSGRKRMGELGNEKGGSNVE